MSRKKRRYNRRYVDACSEYPFASLAILEEHIINNALLSDVALNVYQSYRYFELKQNGYCKMFVAPCRDIAKWSGRSKDSVTQAHVEIQKAGLITLSIGNPIREKKKATEIIRKSLEEVKDHYRQGDDDAHILARELNGKPYYYFGKEYITEWGLGHTERLYSKGKKFSEKKDSDNRLHIQGEPEGKRVEGLQVGLPEDLIAIEPDIEAAEPTIIKHVLGLPLNWDLYGIYREAASLGRTKKDKELIKNAILRINYHPNSAAVYATWPEPARNNPMLKEYVEKLITYKEKLNAEAKRDKYVTTLTGRRVYREKKKNCHNGNYFCWMIQGTVADIINSVCLRLIREGICKDPKPIHDSILAVVRKEDADKVRNYIIEAAREKGIKVVVN